MGSLNRRAREHQRRSQETGTAAQVPRLLDWKAQTTAQEPRSLRDKTSRPLSPLWAADVSVRVEATMGEESSPNIYRFTLLKKGIGIDVLQALILLAINETELIFG